LACLDSQGMALFDTPQGQKDVAQAEAVSARQVQQGKKKKAKVMGNLHRVEPGGEELTFALSNIRDAVTIWAGDWPVAIVSRADADIIARKLNESWTPWPEST